MKTISKINKNLKIKPSGRSSDYIAPDFLYNCGADCKYCYVKRFQNDVIYRYKNTDEILNAIHTHSLFAIGEVEKPNQTHSRYVTYDLGCHTDISLHLKQLEFGKIVDYFKNSEHAFGTFATKFVNEKLLDYNPNKKMRVRLSFIPTPIKIEVQKTDENINLIRFGNELLKAGYEVHFSFAPIIICKDWLLMYKRLFLNILEHFEGTSYSCECIFLTHNKSKHAMNVVDEFLAEGLLWNPSIQVEKTSQYGGTNVRYKNKKKYVDQFTTVLLKEIPTMNIRYIF